MKYHDIQMVSQISGVSVHCVRAWERRYGAIKPQRGPSGRRQYSDEELERAVLLGKLCQMGCSIGNIAKLSDEELGEYYEKLLSGVGQQKAVKTTKSLVPPEYYLTNMMMALDYFKFDVLSHEIDKASIDLGERDFVFQIILPLFQRIGRDVESGRLSIAQEHSMSAIAKFFISRRLAQISAERKTRPRFKALLAAPEGEFHEIGLLSSALLMASQNIDVFYLGENLPSKVIGEVANNLNPDVVLMSIGRFYQKLPGKDIGQLMREMKSLLHEKTSLWMGGHIPQETRYQARNLAVRTFVTLEELTKEIEV